MFCSNCGVQNPAEQAYCGSCGSPLTNGTQSSRQQPSGGQEYYYQATQPNSFTPQSYPQPAQPAYYPQPGYGQTQVMAAPRKSGMKTILIILLVIALLAGAFLAYRYFFGQQPGDTVDKFFSSMNKMDINSMVSCFDPVYEKAFKAATSLVSKYIGIDLGAVIDLVPALYDFGLYSNSGYELQRAEYEILSEEIHNDNATVNCQMTLYYSDGSSSSATGSFLLKKFGSSWRIVEIM